MRTHGVLLKKVLLKKAEKHICRSLGERQDKTVIDKTYGLVTTVEVAFHCHKQNTTTANGVRLLGNSELLMELVSSAMHPPPRILVPNDPGKLVERATYGSLGISVVGGSLW